MRLVRASTLRAFHSLAFAPEAYTARFPRASTTCVRQYSGGHLPLIPQGHPRPRMRRLRMLNGRIRDALPGRDSCEVPDCAKPALTCSGRCEWHTDPGPTPTDAG